MTAPVAFVPAGDPDAADTGFEALRSAGIRALQQLCGSAWTDFNSHDPGVTMLEQLVYGLSDLAYRTGFDMADYLAGPDGTIDYEAQALYAPEAILPCAPLTVDDYRRVLYGEIPELDDVWIAADANGLLTVDVLAAPEAQLENGTLARRVHAVVAAHRALGTDLEQVREVRPRAYYLRGEIDTCGTRPQAEVLARILFDCGACLSSGLSARRLRDVIAADLEPEAVFDGPATHHGYVEARPGGAAAGPVTVSELIGVIQRIDGVQRIRALAIVDDALQPCLAIPRDPATGTYGVLAFPADESTIDLLRLQPEQGIEYGVSEQTLPATPARRAVDRRLVDEARLELAKLRFEQRALRASEGPAHYALPTGRYRGLRDYHSVQHEFPAVYGVGRFGLPHSASAERKAQAYQLQGFLYPMEQLMANYLQNLQDFRHLFGMAHDGACSYGTQFLDAPAVPGVAELYDGGPAQARARLPNILAQHDDHAERKSRVYDYLLALYGEAFPQTALRRFNHYHLDDTDGWLLDAKRRLLQALVVLGRDRGSGADVTLALDADGAVPPLAWRASILLGFDDGAHYRSLCPSRDGTALELAEQDDLDAPLPAPAEWLPVPPASAGGAGAVVPMPMPAPRGPASEAAFRDGAALANYRLASEDGACALYVRDGARWHMLGRYDRQEKAVAAAHAAVHELAALNRRCEGMHVVEHILLRPRPEPAAHGAQPHGHPAFYDARISIVLPRWTLRCADRAFRNLVEGTVREHCPAHLHPGFLWLGPGAMARFEQLHATWRSALRAWHAGPQDAGAGPAAALNDSAGALVHFLRAHYREPA